MYLSSWTFTTWTYKSIRLNVSKLPCRITTNELHNFTLLFNEFPLPGRTDYYTYQYCMYPLGPKVFTISKSLWWSNTISLSLSCFTFFRHSEYFKMFVLFRLFWLVDVYTRWIVLFLSYWSSCLGNRVFDLGTQILNLGTTSPTSSRVSFIIRVWVSYLVTQWFTISIRNFTAQTGLLEVLTNPDYWKREEGEGGKILHLQIMTM